MKPMTVAVLGMAGMLQAAPLMTEWGEKVTSENCWRDYPRPQMVRDNWTCLNGDWDYAITSTTNTPGRPTAWMGKIRVPYAIESALSGVGRLLQPDEFLWYTRQISVKKESGRRILLHFDGVDFRSMVFIGHEEVTLEPHEGGQVPFMLDITDYVKDGANELTVCVWDPSGDRRAEGNFYNTRGKQDLRPYGCFYTRVSGIWQSVWMETVPEEYIRGYTVTPDIDKGTVSFTFDKIEGAGEVEVSTDLPKDFSCWSDQGWWPDGLLTPPSEEAMAFDIQTLKDCGFNTMRKHIKVEPLRYYALCDKMGLLVLQDMPCAGSHWDCYKRSETVPQYGFFRHELRQVIDHLRNVPSIVMWVPFFGQGTKC